jgi:hypothetical protein
MVGSSDEEVFGKRKRRVATVILLGVFVAIARTTSILAYRDLNPPSGEVIDPCSNQSSTDLLKYLERTTQA